MKYFLTLLLLIPLGIKAQDSTLITNLQLKGGTIKIVSALMFGTPDTSVTNTFNKWRNDYIDGSPPNDNANVTISISKTTTVSYIYGLLLQIPAGVTEVEDVLGDFKTSIAPKRATNTYLDRLCDDQENKFTTDLSTLKNVGFKLLSSQ
jgi:hypothetical protein